MGKKDKRDRTKKNFNNVTDIKSIKDKKKRMTKKISLAHVIIAVVIIYAIITFVKQEIVIRDLIEKNKVAAGELKDLKTDISDLKQKINKSDTPEYIEKIGREELDMIKPHEIIYKDENKQNSSEISD